MDGEENEEGAVVVTNVYGDFCVRKARRKRQKLLVREMFFDYANNTTLHGLPYTTKRGLTMTEKIFWLVTFIASVCLCGCLINNVWVKWQTSPVIVTVSEQLVSVSKVPFPSVTICPQLKSKASVYNHTAEIIRLKELVNKTGNMSLTDHEMEVAKLDDLNNVCHWYTYPWMNKVLPRKADTAKNIYDVAPKEDDIFIYCGWHNYERDPRCKQTVSRTLTREGLCFNVNSLPANEILRLENIHRDYPYLTANQASRNWTVDHGYTDFNSKVYPVAGKENAAHPDLEMVLIDIFSEHDSTCNVLHSGFKVYIQHPADLPQSSLYHYAVLNGEVSSMALSFSILNTSESLKKYPAAIRQCYFPDERYLKYFKIYTASNCRLECISNYTFSICDCVGFYMPRNSSMKVCTSQNTICKNEALDTLVKNVHNGQDNNCLCLPSCNSVDYDAEILKTKFNFRAYLESASQVNNWGLNLTGTNFSKLEMYFKRPRFVSMRRSELFGLTDFLANIGGLLGLFLGFSFLSLVEIFYFLTLRLCCALKKDLKKEKLERTNTIAIPQKY